LGAIKTTKIIIIPENEQVNYIAPLRHLEKGAASTCQN
jgi:hypothetical protein